MDRNDQDHARCAAFLGSAEEPLVVPAPVLVEVEWLSSRRLGPAPFDAVLADVAEGALRVAELVAADYARARALMTEHDDFPLGFVDAAVVAILERLGEQKLVTLDHRHFRAVRPRHVRALVLLPADTD
jgi:uncharacterized protein